MCNNYVEFQLNQLSRLAVHKGHTYRHTFDFIYIDNDALASFTQCLTHDLQTYKSTCVTSRKNKNPPQFVYPSIEKIYRNISAILYNWKHPT